MNDGIFFLKPEGRWHVPVSDPGSWRLGVYRPEFSSPSEITVLERHTCPELFICQAGRMGLVVGRGGDERTLVLEPGQAVLVTGYHNGYAVDPGGHFLVVERTSFTTEYVDRVSGIVIETRTVG